MDFTNLSFADLQAMSIHLADKIEDASSSKDWISHSKYMERYRVIKTEMERRVNELFKDEQYEVDAVKS